MAFPEKYAYAQRPAVARTERSSPRIPTAAATPIRERLATAKRVNLFASVSLRVVSRIFTWPRVAGAP
jgi:hypothetical protein